MKAQVETQLVAESKTTTSGSQNASGASLEWNDLGMDMNLDLDGGDILDSFDMMQSGFGFQTLGAPSEIPIGDGYSQELLSLGLQEPLPPQDMIDEL